MIRGHQKRRGHMRMPSSVPIMRPHPIPSRPFPARPFQMTSSARKKGNPMNTPIHHAAPKAQRNPMCTVFMGLL